MSWFVIVCHPVPLGILTAAAFVMFQWPLQPGILARSFWLGVLMGGLTNVLMVVIPSAKLKGKKAAILPASVDAQTQPVTSNEK